GVVPDDRVAVELERIDRRGEARARGQVVGELGGIDLEGNRDIQPDVTRIAQCERELLEAVDRRFQPFVADGVLCLAREQLVDFGRLGVCDRVTYDTVTRSGDIGRLGRASVVLASCHGLSLFAAA